MPKIGMSELAPALAWPKYFYQGFNRQYFRKVLSYRPIAYWPLWEASGSVAYDISGNGLHGAYTGVTLGEIGVGDGRSCPLFDGANDYVDVYSAGLRDAFNSSEGSLLIWCKVSTGAWIDGAARAPVLLSKSPSGGNVYVLLRKEAGNNAFKYFRNDDDGSVDEQVTYSETAWFSALVTWSVAADELKCFLAGSQVGSTQSGLTATADLLASDNCFIGAIDTAPLQIWNGHLAHCAVFDKVLNATEGASLAAV